MPLFDITCNACKTPNIEILSSFDKAKERKCELCGGTMQIVPSRSNFKVNGYSEANGYHRPTINYDGSEG